MKICILVPLVYIFLNNPEKGTKKSRTKKYFIEKDINYKIVTTLYFYHIYCFTYLRYIEKYIYIFLTLDISSDTIILF